MKRIIITIFFMIMLAACGTQQAGGPLPEQPPAAEQPKTSEPEPVVAAREEPADTDLNGNTGTAGEPEESGKMGGGGVVMSTPEPGVSLETAMLRDSRDKTMTSEPSGLTHPDTDELSIPVMPARPVERRPRQTQTRLKAGEVDDNQRWPEYLDFVRDYRGPDVHQTHLSNRQIITILDRDGNPVPNAQVTISDSPGKSNILWTNTTYADGRTMFFPSKTSGNGMIQQPPRMFNIKVTRDGFDKETIIDIQSSRSTKIWLGGTMEYGEQIPLDVMFLLDATGSMSDEINQIKSTLESISRQVTELPSQPNLRFGMVAYRDRGDIFVTQLYDFEPNIQRFSKDIRNVEAAGGDDYPESLNQALHEAVNDASWRRDAIRLVFLIADAPPHLDYAQDEDYAIEMVRAREKGIKIFSVASSGLDEQGEYIFRQIAQQTMGRFIFILYQTNGPGRPLDTPHDVEQFTVNHLDSLIVRLIREELETKTEFGLRMK